MKTKTQEECLFCRLAEKKGHAFYEDNLFYAQFDAFPVSPGHAEVIPKRHVVSLLDLTNEEWQELKFSLAEAVKVIESTDFRGLYQNMIDNPLNDKSKWFCEQMMNHVGFGKKPDAYNHGNNDGEAAGRTIHHLHWHIIPRYHGDVEDPRGGIRHIIPELGNYSK